MITARSSHTKLVLVIVALWFSISSFATDYYWVNNSGNWNDVNHWSLTSGGSSAGQTPGSQDNVIFDDNSFDSGYPVINVNSNVDVRSFAITSQAAYPSFQSNNNSLTIHRDFLVTGRFHIALGGNGELVFENNGTQERQINTNGILLNTNVRIRGNWALTNHLILSNAHTLSIQNGIFKSNGNTIHAYRTLINEQTVSTDLTGSYVSAIDNLDLSKSINIGGQASFNLTYGDFTTTKKGGHAGSGSNWNKSTVLCAAPADPLQLDLNVTSNYNGADISCKDSCDGELTIIASGTPGPFSYSFEFGPNTSQTIYPGLCAGTYTVTVTDSSNLIAPGFYAQCNIQEPVQEPGAVTLLLGPITDPTCPTSCDGSTVVLPGGGTGVLTVFWPNSGETTTNPVGLCTGVNPVVVTDVNLCQLDSFVTVTDPPAIEAPVTITNSVCNGDCNAEILVNPSGGNGGPYTFTWGVIPTSGQGTNPGIGFCAGIIPLSVFDVDGCQFDTSYTIADPPVLTISAAFVSNALCNGSCDGAANSTPTGGVPNYTYEWYTSPGAVLVSTDQNPTTLCAGDYYVVVTDDSGCTATSNIITIGEPAPLSSIVDGYDVSCFGVCDGSVDVDVTGGVLGYTYSWVTFPGLVGVGATDSLSGLCPGQYQITVTDFNGCIDGPILIDVFEPLPLTISTTPTDPSCYDLCDGSAITVAGGGTPSYSYSWVPLPGIGGGSPNPSGMCAGIYDLTVTDANGCQITDQTTLNSPPLYDISVSQTDLQCFGDTNGDATVTVNSGGSGVGYTYTWAPAPPVGQFTPSASGLTAGIWCVTISDDQLCDTTICFTITEPPLLTATASLIANVSCFGDCDGSAQVVIAGGVPNFSVQWDDVPGAQTTLVASALCAGTYNVVVTDNNGCTATDQIDILEPAPFDLTTSQVDLICNGICDGQATVTMNGGGTGPYTISWDDPLFQNTFTATGLCAGVWTATVVDQNLCDTIIPFTIIEPPLIVIDTNVIVSSCFGTCSGQAYITAIGGTGAYTFEWYDVLTGLPLGNNNDSIAGLCPGDYYASVTDANGCIMLSDTMTITELPEIFASIVSVVDATCGVCDGSAEVTASGGVGSFTFIWTPAPGTGQGTNIVTGLCGGVYNVDVIDDANGCSIPLSVTVNSVAIEVLSMDSVDVSCFGLCDGQAIVTYTVLDPPYTVEWFDYTTGLPLGIIDNPASNPSTASGLCAGTYTAVVTNTFGCVSSDTITILEPPQITATLTPTDVACNGDCNGSITALASGGTGAFNYLWNPLPGSGQGTPTAGGLCAGNWGVTITDAMGCSENFIQTIAEPVLLIIDTETSTPISCFGANDGTATVTGLGGIPAYTYNWIDCNTGLPIGQTTQQATNLPPGDYQCEITDANGCTVTSGCLPVIEPATLTGIINILPVNCYGNCDGLIDIVPAGGSAPYFYQWEDEFNNPIPGQTNDTLNNVCQGIYYVTVTDFNGCAITFGPVDMTSPSSPWVVTTTQTNITCSGSCDGTAGVTVLAGNNPPYSYQWDDIPLSTTPNVANLCAGVFSVVISDAGICDTTISFTIVDNNPIFANANITNIDCFGNCTGEITVGPSGGIPPYTVTWSDLQVGNTASNLCVGSITCTITDGIGCTKDTIINISEPTEMISNSFFNNPTCGVCNGSATVNVVGGTGAYTYLWTPDPTTCCGGAGQGTNSATGLCSGIFSVDITDANGCVLTEVFGLSDVNAEVLTMVSNDASCFGLCDGDAEAQYVCADPACTNQWYDGTTGLPLVGEVNSTIAGLCTGDYYIEVTNNSGCVAVGQVTINSPSQIIANEVIVPVTCNGDSDGSIVVAPSGGSGAGYSYAWNPIPPNGDGTNSALNIGAGTWELTITDGSGCSELLTFNLIDPTPIVITPTITDVSCFGGCDGSVLVSVAGGYGGYSYQWYNAGLPIVGETSTLITNLCSGFYDIEVIDANGCSIFFNNIPISDPIPITGPISGTDVTCNSACDGTATVVPAGGFPPYFVNWYDAGTGLLIGQTNPTATNLCPGDYYAVISDNNGCSFTSAIQNIVEPSALTYTINSTDATCFGFCDGTADIVMAGGSIPYTYIWLDILGNPVVGGGGMSVINLCEGNYTIEVIDNNGCTTGQQPVVINGFPELTANTFSNDATCGVADGNATVFANGGNPPYTYQWMDASMVDIVGETNSVLLNVVAGIYFVTVTDLNGCNNVFQATVSNLPSTTLTWDNVVDPTCAGSTDGFIEITATGVNPPLTYSWNPGGLIAEDPSGLGGGTWTLTITDAMGCINIYDTLLVDPSPMVISSSSTPSDCGQCNGGAAVTVTGGTGAINILWNNGLIGSPITDLCTGVYEAQITDGNGCIELEQVTIDNTGGLTGQSLVSAISCAGQCDGQAVVTGVGGSAPYNYLWLHNGSTSDTESGLCAGTYFCDISDASGCTWTEQIVLVDPNPIMETATIVNPNCLSADGSIAVITTGGNMPHTYSWDTGDITPGISGLTAGTYTLTVTDFSGCQMIFVYGLSDLNAAVIDLTTTDVSCYNSCDGTIDTLSLTNGTAPFTFQWIDDVGSPIIGETNPLITGLCDADYMIQVVDALGCVSYQSATITQPDTILLNPLFLFDPSCNGLCDGEIISNPIGGTLPFSFLWDDPLAQTGLNDTSLCDGTYTVTITDANGCQVQQTGTIFEPTPIIIVQDSLTDATCLNSPNGEVYITVTGGNPGYAYQWISQTAIDTFLVEDLTGILPMDYYLEVTDANGCIALDTASVDTMLVVLANAGLDSLLCFGNGITLVGTSNAMPGADFTWYDTTGVVLVDTNEMVLPSLPAGIETYILEVNYAGCIHTDTVTITTADSIWVEAGPDIEMFPLQTEVIGGSPTSDLTNSITWTPSIYLDDPTTSNPSVVQPDSSMTYYVIALDTNGCTVSDSMYVEILPDIVIPDGISPDGNGLNDTWILEFLQQYPGTPVMIQVYNRWGELLFESDENYADDWGGTTKNGKRLPAGTYYYVIEIDHEDFPDPFTGPITIMW